MGKVERFLEHAEAIEQGPPDIGRAAQVSGASVERIARRHLEGLERRVAELQAMASTVQHLVHHCHGDHRPDCPILEDLAKA